MLMRNTPAVVIITLGFMTFGVWYERIVAKRGEGGGGGEKVGDFGFITLGVWYERIVAKRGGGRMLATLGLLP